MVTKLSFVFDFRYNSLSVLSAKLYFLEISLVHQKLWSFKYDAENFEFKFS